MALIESLLDKFEDHEGFERLCCEVMLREGYANIEPTGGTGDKARDAEEKLFQFSVGKLLTYFQYSLQKTVAAKVRKTLRRLREEGLRPTRLIFVFSTKVLPTVRDSLTLEALSEYGLDIDIKGQRFLAIRLGNPTYRDITTKYFARELAELKSLWEEDKLFVNGTTASEHEQRCLMNLMLYARHPMAHDIREQVVRQATRTVLSRAQQPLHLEELIQMVVDYLPTHAVPRRDNIITQIRSLTDNGEIVADGNSYSLSLASISEIQFELADITSARQAVYEQLRSLIPASGPSSPQGNKLRQLCHRFLSDLFSQYGNEVAHAILEPESGIPNVSSSLSRDRIDDVLSCTLGQLPPQQGKACRLAMHSLLAKPSADSLAYLHTLSSSYILMQMLNIDPNGINLQRVRIKNSVAILDTDVVLTGIVDGANQQGVSQSIARMCQKVGMQVFATEEGLREIIFRIERSIHNFNDLGQPAMMPPDKKDLISDLFLNVYFQQVERGLVRSFGEYIQPYYDVSNPRKCVEQLVLSVLGIPVERLDRYCLKQQDDKVKRLQSTIEASRKSVSRFKMSELYHKDAFQMVVVEQQNREAISTGKPGRWYLVSSDRHILGAYLKHKNAFRVKPCVLPPYFLETLRTAPEASSDKDTFGAILQSEAMLRGAGKDFTPIIAALSWVGVKALEMPRDRLLALIEDMDRADFTQWLLLMRSSGKISDAMREEVRESLDRTVAESKSRDETIRTLKSLLEEKEAAGGSRKGG